MDMGILRFNPTTELFLLTGHNQMESVRQTIESGSGDLKNDDLILVLVRHDKSPEGQERTKRLFDDLNQANH